MTELRIRIMGRNMPTQYCEQHDVRQLGIIRGKEVVDAISTDASSAVFDLAVDVARRPDCLDFRGPYVNGGPTERFLYLNWGGGTGGGGRTKLQLLQIAPAVVEAAMEVGLLVADLDLTDDRGRPAYATVHEPRLTWRAAEQPDTNPLQKHTMAPEPTVLAALAAANHQSWFATRATHAGGSVTRRFGGTFAYADGLAMNVGFPRLTAEEAGPFVDEVVELARRHRATEVGWWALDDSANAVVGPTLLARGFHWGWQPHWMVYDLEQPGRTARPVPDGIEIVEIDDTSDLGVANDVPYAGEIAQPPRMWTWVALENGRRVGNISLHVSDGAETGDRPHGGLYSCGVASDARLRGIGTALTTALLTRARELGCRHVTLNATPDGERLYRAVGFRTVGHGQTWWLTGQTIRDDPIPRAVIAFVEAVGTGDLDGIDHGLRHSQVDLDEPLACGMTSVQVAVRTGQRGSVDRLIAGGALLDVLSACDLGRKQDVPGLLADHPKLLDRRDPDLGATPLHLAVQRGDLELAKMLLAASAEPGATDAVFGATPLGWARRLGKEEFIQLLGNGPDAERGQ